MSSQSFLARLRCLRTTVLPMLMNAPINNQPTDVLCMATFRFGLWDALRSNSSPILNANFGLRLGTPSGHSRTAPSRAAHAYLIELSVKYRVELVYNRRKWKRLTRIREEHRMDFESTRACPYTNRVEVSWESASWRRASVNTKLPRISPLRC